MLGFDVLFDAAAAASVADQAQNSSPSSSLSSNALASIRNPSTRPANALRRRNDEEGTSDSEAEDEAEIDMDAAAKEAAAFLSSSPEQAKQPRSGKMVFKRSVTMLTRKLVRELSESYRRCFPREEATEERVYEARLESELLKKVIPQKLEALASQCRDPEAIKAMKRADNAQRQRAFRERQRALRETSQSQEKVQQGLQLLAASEEADKGAAVCEQIHFRKRKRGEENGLFPDSNNSSPSSIGPNAAEKTSFDPLRCAEALVRERYSGETAGRALLRESKLAFVQAVVRGVHTGVGRLAAVRQELKDKQAKNALTPDENAFLQTLQERYWFHKRVKEDLLDTIEVLEAACEREGAKAPAESVVCCQYCT